MTDSMKGFLAVLALIVAIGIVGEMSYQDAIMAEAVSYE